MTDDDIRDLFQGLGLISVRRMFGGKSIYVDGDIVAIVLNDELMIKGDAQTSAALEAAGGEQWVYEGKRGPAHMPYWSIPVDVIEDADEMRNWARMGLEASLRAAKNKAAGKSKGAAKGSPKPKSAKQK